MIGASSELVQELFSFLIIAQSLCVQSGPRKGFNVETYSTTMSGIDVPDANYKIFKQIHEALQICSIGEPVTIEVLPESHSLKEGSHVIIEDNNVGIPRKSLRKAYLVARRIFFSELEEPRPDSSAILAASDILLLYEPEQLTAANARKRLMIEAEAAGEESQFRYDIWFLDSLFRSPLHRHTKSPTLWGHRRWLRARTDTRHSLDREKELQVIMSAAQTHPRNYYAWDYLRWLDTHSIISKTERPQSSFVNSIEAWCLRHPSDTSGWSFLLFLLVYQKSTPEEVQNVATKVFNTAVALKLRNEALWYFLRSLLTVPRLTTLDFRHNYLDNVNSIALSPNEKLRTRIVAKNITDTLTNASTK